MNARMEQAERILALEACLHRLLRSELLRRSFDEPVVAAARRVLLSKIGRPRPRHKWLKSVVDVPWSDLPGNLYTCIKCSMTRQSVPAGPNRWKVEFVKAEIDGIVIVLYGRTPPCQGEA